MLSKNELALRLARVTDYANAVCRKVETDDRFHYPAAQVQVNAPLALEQVAMKCRRAVALDVLKLATGGEVPA